MKWKKIVNESAEENENYGYTDDKVNAEYLSDILNSITRDLKSSGRRHPKLKFDMTTIKEAFNKFAELCGLSIAEDYSMIDIGGIDEAIQDLAEYYGDGAVEAGEEKDEGVLWALVELCNRLEPVPASTKSKVKGMLENEVVSEGDDEPIMPDKAVAGKPIAAKAVYEEDPRQSFIIHSKRQCKDKWEKQAFQYVMLTGKAYEDEFGIMVPVLQRGVPKKYKELLSRRFPVSLEEID